MKAIPIVLTAFALTAQAGTHMAYVEVNTNALSNVGCYEVVETGKPFFDMASIFAANIDGDTPNEPTIYLNPQTKTTIDDRETITSLQSKGIKVLITLLGNHKNAGWSCMTDETAINTFANTLVELMNKYNLDGIDIDDEYSRCQANSTSLIRISNAIKRHPGFQNKLLTKALFRDSYIFESNYQDKKISDYLDYGWEMTYGGKNYNDRLTRYVDYGMSKNRLLLGINAGKPYGVESDVQYVANNNYQGVMIYDVKKDSLDVLNKIAQIESGHTVTVVPNCLH